MNDDSLNSNFEWKKKGFDKREKPSRRIDALEASASDSKKKNKILQAIPLADTSNVSFNSHLKKMRKRIKQALDEDEDDEDEFENIIATPVFAVEEQFSPNPLFEGLNDSEKKIIEQNEAFQQVQMQQNAAKLNALLHVNKLAGKAGLSKLSAQAFAENIQNNGWERDTFETAVKNYIAPQLKIKRSHLTDEKTQKLLFGLKRLQKIGGIAAVRGMKVDDVIKLTDKKYNDKHIAQTVLKKTGRKLSPAEDRKLQKKQTQQKVHFKDLLQQKQQQDRVFTKV